MQIVPRFDLPRLLSRAGLDAASREFPDQIEIHRLTVRETTPLAYVSGPARKAVYPDGRVEGPYPLADRPALSGFIATVMTEIGAERILATVPEGTFWLNNKSMADYFAEVPDAVRVCRFLRSRGLTDRFQGGFLLVPSQFSTTLPLLAAQTYSGGADVLFTVLKPSIRLTAVACHHFDIHFASPDAALVQRIAALTPPSLTAETLAFPEIPELSPE